MLAAILLAVGIAILPPSEERTVSMVVQRYNLTVEQTALLKAIRRAENGRSAVAWGVADRRCRGYYKQCCWAANTIKLRYNGDLQEFSKRWCPLNDKVWYNNVLYFMRRQGVEPKRR